MSCQNTYAYFVHCITPFQIEFDCLLIARVGKSISIRACWICLLCSVRVQQTSVIALRKELPAQYFTEVVIRLKKNLCSDSLFDSDAVVFK